jgi:hypothetical protein
MNESAGLLLLLAVAVALACKGLPAMAAALQGRRIEAAVRHRDGRRLRQLIATAAGLAELRRVLLRLPTAELMALGEGIAGAAADEHGARLLSAIAQAVERRDLVLERWVRAVARRQRLHAARGPVSREDER